MPRMAYHFLRSFFLLFWEYQTMMKVSDILDNKNMYAVAYTDYNTMQSAWLGYRDDGYDYGNWYPVADQQDAVLLTSDQVRYFLTNNLKWISDWNIDGISIHRYSIQGSNDFLPRMAKDFG